METIDTITARHVGMETIALADLNSTYIRAALEPAGVTELRIIGHYGPDGDRGVTLYEYDEPGTDGRVSRQVFGTNALPVWESDEYGFSALCGEFGIVPTEIDGDGLGDMPVFQAARERNPDLAWSDCASAVALVLGERFPYADIRGVTNASYDSRADWIPERDWLAALEVADDSFTVPA